MNLSLTEFASLCRTAAKGAGFSWGQAGDIGMACRWLAAHDLWTQGQVERLFGKQEGCPFTAGMTLADLGVMGPKSVYCPIAMLPFIALLNEQCTMTWDGGSFDIGPNGDCSGQGDWPSQPVAVTLVKTDTSPKVSTLNSRADIADIDVAALKKLAALTYAPATEESRRLGAG